MADVDKRHGGEANPSDSGMQPSAGQPPMMGTFRPSRRPSLERMMTGNLSIVTGFRQHFDLSVVRRVRMAHLARRDWRVRVLLLLEEPASSCAAHAWARVLGALILTSCGLLLLLTSSLDEDEARPFVALDRACSVTICAEWALRVVLYISLAFRSPAASKDSFSFSGAGGATEVLGGGRGLLWLMVDTVASIPLITFAVMWPSTDEQLGLCARAACELVASLRLFRLISLARHSNASHILVDVLAESVAALMVPFYMLCVSSLFFGVALRYLEKEFAGDASRIASIADGVYFMWVTFSTVGYGDISPISEPGKIVTLLAITVGLLFFAMPLSIVGQSFANAMEHRNMRLVVVALQEDLLSRRMGPHGLRQKFDEIDVDASGELDEAEFADFLKSNSHLRRLSPSQTHIIFTKLDYGRNGTVSFEELSRAVFPNLDIFDHGGTSASPEPSPSPSTCGRRIGHEVLSAAGAEVEESTKESEATDTSNESSKEDEASAKRCGGGGSTGDGDARSTRLSNGRPPLQRSISDGVATAGGHSFVRRVRRAAAVVDQLTAPPTPGTLRRRSPDASGRVTPTGGGGMSADDVPYMSRLLGYLPGSFASVSPSCRTMPASLALAGGYDGYGGADAASFRRQRRRRAATSDAVVMAPAMHEARRQFERSCAAEGIAEGKGGGSGEGGEGGEGGGGDGGGDAERTSGATPDSEGVSPVAIHPARLAARRRARSGDRMPSLQFAPDTYYVTRDGHGANGGLSGQLMVQANGATLVRTPSPSPSPNALYSPLSMRKASGDFRPIEPGGGGGEAAAAVAAVQEVRSDVKRLETQMEALAAQVALVLKAVQPQPPGGGGEGEGSGRSEGVDVRVGV